LVHVEDAVLRFSRSLIAARLPARRAARIEPTSSLRAE
jgi:ABC-type lipoprotein release transport system permease subunit